mmetsp:Transcript_13740/g.9717  ORF Transcript_13740/g.9717 Transcript_13740/m.9717 type:complete len:228 (+) Transcript_13740:222-905(+)
MIKMVLSSTSASSNLIKNISKQMKTKCIKNLNKDTTILEVDTHAVEEATTKMIDRTITQGTSSSSSTEKPSTKFIMMTSIRVEVDSPTTTISTLIWLQMRNLLNLMRNRCSTLPINRNIVENISKFLVKSPFKIFALTWNLMMIRSLTSLHLLSQKVSIRDFSNTSGKLHSQEKRRSNINERLKLKRTEDVSVKRKIVRWHVNVNKKKRSKSSLEKRNKLATKRTKS